MLHLHPRKLLDESSQFLFGLVGVDGEVAGQRRRQVLRLRQEVLNAAESVFESKNKTKKIGDARRDSLTNTFQDSLSLE